LALQILDILYFIKFKPNGDTISTRLIDEFNLLDNNQGLNTSSFFQNTDNSFTCVITMYDINSIVAGVTGSRPIVVGFENYAKIFSNLNKK
jgi:hypothetical protein